jgi:excisionase family DNA binding protein
MVVSEAPVRPGLVRVAEAAEFLSVSRGALYAAIARAEVPVKRIGKSMRIPRWWLEEQAAKDEQQKD